MVAEILLVHLAAMASPGPNVLVVAHTSLGQSRRAGLWCAAGVATGALAWSGAVAVGLGLLLTDSTVARDVLRIAGGAYLVWLGVRLVRAAPRPVAIPAGPLGEGSRRQAWARGVATNLSNPKAAVFYLSIFGAMLPRDATLGLRTVVVALIAVNALLWHSVIAVGFSTGRAQAGYVRRKLWVDRVAGTLIATFGFVFATGLA